VLQHARDNHFGILGPFVSYTKKMKCCEYGPRLQIRLAREACQGKHSCVFVQRVSNVKRTFSCIDTISLPVAVSSSELSKSKTIGFLFAGLTISTFWTTLEVVPTFSTTLPLSANRQRYKTFFLRYDDAK